MEKEILKNNKKNKSTAQRQHHNPTVDHIDVLMKECLMVY